MAAVKYYLEKRRDSKGEIMSLNVPLILNYSFDGSRLQYFTGERIDSKHYFEDYWKKPGKEPIKRTAPGADLINRNLRSLKLHLETIHSNAKALGIRPTVEYFREKLNEVFKAQIFEKEITLFSALDDYLIFVKFSQALNSFKSANTAIKHIKEYVKNKNAGFNCIDIEFVEKLRLSLVNKGLIFNTIAKNMRVFKSFLVWSRKSPRRYHSFIDTDFSTQEKPGAVVFLNMTEIQVLEGLKNISPSLARVRDIFIWGCYTGMRYSDIFSLKPTDIKNNYISFYIKKGSQTVPQTVPIVPKARAILERYIGHSESKALPVISNQKMNDLLKELCKIAGFNERITLAEKQGNGQVVEKEFFKYELISCHTSRKSFVTVAMELGMSEATIKAITGHSKGSKAFARYYDLVDKVKQNEMIRIFGNG